MPRTQIYLGSLQSYSYSESNSESCHEYFFYVTYFLILSLTVVLQQYALYFLEFNLLEKTVAYSMINLHVTKTLMINKI